MRFGILELQNRVTKSSYAKWRQTSSYLLENFYRNSSFELLTRRLNFYFSNFELLTRCWKILNFTSSYQLEVEKWRVSVRFELLFYRFRVTNSRLKNKKFHLELLARSWKYLLRVIKRKLVYFFGHPLNKITFTS